MMTPGTKVTSCIKFETTKLMALGFNKKRNQNSPWLMEEHRVVVQWPDNSSLAGNEIVI